ncbi:MAG: type II toxin-antitoxin system PemK/MazF family toxin [Defluviitaleaceae bacterium]|nr:type II toxin-antitoxin system PemK/MazF family toxin [Defluviitaleaceae bacterium]
MVKQGDIIMISFDPVHGSEQAGYRPAVVVSNDLVISKTNIVNICPITSRNSKSALNVLLDEHTATKGSVLCAHNRAVDLKARRYKIVERLPKHKLNEIIDKLVNMITPYP